jgi:hypothetical protein
MDLDAGALPTQIKVFGRLRIRTGDVMHSKFVYPYYIYTLNTSYIYVSAACLNGIFWFVDFRL